MVDDDTLFQLGAVSCAYTTTLLAALAGEGEVAWDQPVRQVWSGFRLEDDWATRVATYRDLTAARSGLPAYTGAELRAFGCGRREILRRLRYLPPAAGFPLRVGSTGRRLHRRRGDRRAGDRPTLGAAAARNARAGAHWRRVHRARPPRIRARRGHGDPHRLVNGSMVPQDPSDEDVFAPALGVSSSLDDVIAFARLQLNGGALGGARVAPVGLLAQTLRPATGIDAPPGGPRAAGLGWQLSSIDGRLVASAEGGLASGSSAVVALLPHDGVAVVVLANAYPGGLALGRALTRTLIDFVALGAPQDDWLAAEQAVLEQAALEQAAQAASAAADAGWDWRAAAGDGAAARPPAPAGAAGRGRRAALAPGVHRRLRAEVLRASHGEPGLRRRARGAARPRPDAALRAVERRRVA